MGVDNYEVRILTRMGGWSVQYRDHTGQVRDKFFHDKKERDKFINEMNERPRGYYH